MCIDADDVESAAYDLADIIAADSLVDRDDGTAGRRISEATAVGRGL